jgi:hypothetical protein
MGVLSPRSQARRSQDLAGFFVWSVWREAIQHLKAYRFVPRRGILSLSPVLGGEGWGEGRNVDAHQVCQVAYRFVPRRTMWSRCPHRRLLGSSGKPIASEGTGSTSSASDKASFH